MYTNNMETITNTYCCKEIHPQTRWWWAMGFLKHHNETTRSPPLQNWYFQVFWTILVQLKYDKYKWFKRCIILNVWSWIKTNTAILISLGHVTITPVLHNLQACQNYITWYLIERRKREFLVIWHIRRYPRQEWFNRIVF